MCACGRTRSQAHAPVPGVAALMQPLQERDVPLKVKSQDLPFSKVSFYPAPWAQFTPGATPTDSCLLLLGAHLAPDSTGHLETPPCMLLASTMSQWPAGGGSRNHIQLITVIMGEYP